MDHSRLHNLLSSLHQELKSAESVDPATRKLLEQLRSDLGPIIEAGPEPSSGYGGLRNRLRSAVVGFEASHPELARSIQGVVDSLGSYGI
ncbi:MAG TPA: DUF4404 family protein [Gemmatimonadales bacterium]|nr:DUF4404 family protein [Gemmatimonadales bacterium]